MVQAILKDRGAVTGDIVEFCLGEPFLPIRGGNPSCNGDHHAEQGDGRLFVASISSCIQRPIPLGIPKTIEVEASSCLRRPEVQLHMIHPPKGP